MWYALNDPLDSFVFIYCISVWKCILKCVLRVRIKIYIYIYKYLIIYLFSGYFVKSNTKFKMCIHMIVFFHTQG